MKYGNFVKKIPKDFLQNIWFELFQNFPNKVYVLESVFRENAGRG